MQMPRRRRLIQHARWASCAEIRHPECGGSSRPAWPKRRQAGRFERKALAEESGGGNGLSARPISISHRIASRTKHCRSKSKRIHRDLTIAGFPASSWKLVRQHQSVSCSHRIEIRSLSISNMLIWNANADTEGLNKMRNALICYRFYVGCVNLNRTNPKSRKFNGQT